MHICYTSTLPKILKNNLVIDAPVPNVRKQHTILAQHINYDHGPSMALMALMAPCLGVWGSSRSNNESSTSFLTVNGVSPPHRLATQEQLKNNCSTWGEKLSMLSELNQTSHVRIIWNIQIQLQAVQSVHDQMQRRFATVEIEVYRGKDWNATGLTVTTLWDCWIMNPSWFVFGIQKRNIQHS